MAVSICFFVADSADAQLAYLRVVALPLELLLPPPHAAMMASMPVRDIPKAAARKIKSRRPILPACRSCTSLFMSLIDITPIVVRTMIVNQGFGPSIGIADLELDGNIAYAGE